MYHPHAHGHMLLPDGMFGAILVGDVRLPLGQTVGLEQIPADLHGQPGDPDGPQRRRRDRLLAQRQELPRHRSPTPPRSATGCSSTTSTRAPRSIRCTSTSSTRSCVAKDGYPLDSPYTVDTLNVAPGERYSVLVQVDEPGAWVWHCHILPHVESEAGMFGMVTAIIAE